MCDICREKLFSLHIFFSGMCWGKKHRKREGRQTRERERERERKKRERMREKEKGESRERQTKNDKPIF